MTRHIAVWVWRLLTAVVVAGSAWGLIWLFSATSFADLRAMTGCEGGGNSDACTGGPLFVIFFVMAMVPLLFSFAGFAVSFVHVRAGAIVGTIFGLVWMGFVVLNSELGLDRLGLSVGAVGLIYLSLSLYLSVRGAPKRAEDPPPPPPTAGSRIAASSFPAGKVTFPTEPPYRP